jgi:hypothetical protein
MADGKMCSIRIIRPTQAVDVLRSYRILLNGKDAGKISHNSVLEIATPAGEITVEAKIDWARSQPLTMNTVPGQAIEIEVRNRWGALLGLWAITFGKNSYLLLTPRPAVMAAAAS